jgi:hypothetical protein
MKQCWYKNNTPNDINLRGELGFKFPAYKTINLYKINPSLTSEQILKSEECGLLLKCVESNKILKLPFAPPPPANLVPAAIKEANKPIPSRSKSSVVMDMQELDYVEDMEHGFRTDAKSAEEYAKFADGFSEPMVLDSDGETFQAVVIPPGEETIVIDKGDPQDMEVQQVGSGKDRYLVVGPTE